MNEDNIYKENSNKIEKYHSNPFTNTKEEYYNEIVQKIICSILYSKNIKAINCLVFDLLFDFFIKIIKSIGINSRNFSSLRGSAVVNYIDIKSCLKFNFDSLYKEIYDLKKYNICNNYIFDIVDNVKRDSYINVVQNSYLYYKQLCMKKNEKNDTLNDLSSINYLNVRNDLTQDLSTNENVLFFNEDIDIEKYKEITKLKKKYMHDHMPIVPLSINTKEKKIGYIEKIESCHQSSSLNLSLKSSSLSASSDSSSSPASSLSGKHTDQSVCSDYFNCEKKYTNDDISKEKIEILNILPKLKEIYIQNSKNKKKLKNPETLSFNSINNHEMFDY